MKASLRTSVVMLAMFTLLTGGLYPAIVTAVAQVVFPAESNGSLIVRDGKPIGSSLVGQSFTMPGYFWGRPSATSQRPYNATSSGGSNLGPLNPVLAGDVKARIAALRVGDSALQAVPVDLVTASGSGLDPHISPASAEVQVPRVAKSRGRSEDEVRRLVALHIEGRQLGLLGEPRVSVLRLNLALDGLEPTSNTTAWEIHVPTHYTSPIAAPNSHRTYLSLRELLNQGRGSKPVGSGARTARPSIERASRGTEGDR